MPLVANYSQTFILYRSLFNRASTGHPNTYHEMFPDRPGSSQVFNQSCPNIPVSAIAQAAAPLDFIHSNSQQTLFTPIFPTTSQTAESSQAITVSDQYPESVQLETSSDSDIFITPTKQDTESSSGELSPPTTPTNTVPPPVPLLPDGTKGVESKFKKLQC